MTTRTDTGAKTDAPRTGSTVETASGPERTRVAAFGDAVTDAASSVKGVAADAAARLPDVAATTRAAFEDANRQMRSESDEMLTIGSALSLGLAGGLLIGGANRLLVVGALLPALMMVLTMLDRSSRTRGTTPSPLQGD